MSFLRDNCTFTNLTREILDECDPFVCEHIDLDDFFANDCINYSKELLGKTYCFLLDETPSTIVCAFTISNDSIKASLLPNNRKRKISKPIPYEKRMKTYPAVLIGRLGVNIRYAGKGIGRELMDFIKSWFIDPNIKTGCRFIVVDSYNEERPINYYNRNGFTDLFSSEDQEKEYLGLKSDEALNTRLKYFDLITLST